MVDKFAKNRVMLSQTKLRDLNFYKY